jgi:hypothetical protein
MTDTNELNDLIAGARARGATVIVEYDAELLASEGRRVHQTIRVSGLEGVGPYPMSPISAAETLRRANFRALHGLCRHDRRAAFCRRRNN